jgi:hypothetical protein
MRVKKILAPLGIAVAVALAVPSVSDASRGGDDDPVLVEEDPVVEEEPPAPEEEPAPEPEEEPAPEPAPEPEEEPAPEPEEEPAPEPEEEPAPEPEAEEEEEPAPAPEPAPVVEDPVVAQEAPEPAARPERAPKVKADRGPCHMDAYEERTFGDLDEAEMDRAEKVDRNGNETVCRKDIPGNGRGNTGNGSNIKDDKVR